MAYPMVVFNGKMVLKQAIGFEAPYFWTNEALHYCVSQHDPGSRTGPAATIGGGVWMHIIAVGVNPSSTSEQSMSIIENRICQI